MSTKANQASDQRLSIFLCHASEDKPIFRELDRKLELDGFAPWLDEKKIFPGQVWKAEILAAIQRCDVFLVCLSQVSVSKEGFLQKEITEALDKAEEKPERTIFIIPVRLDDKVTIPERLTKWQWASFVTEDGYQRMLISLRIRAEQIGTSVVPPVFLENNAIVSSAALIRIMLPIEPYAEGIFEELKAIQQEFKYLPEEELRRVAIRRKLRFEAVHEIAIFYRHFRLQPPAAVDVGICDDMTCHLRGALKLRQALEQSFKSVPQSDLTFRNISCLGRCDHAPAFVINDRYYDGLSSDEVVNTVFQTLKGHLPEVPSYAVDNARLSIDPYDGVASRPYDALRKLVQNGKWEGLLEELRAAGLQGMGGVGFPTWAKWETVRKASSSDRHVICNANDSEPGVIKTRFILAQLPHLVIEGIILAGLFVFAKRGYLYIRHEYQDQIAILRAELERCRKEGLIGQNILGTGLSFDIVLFVSPGGYICGEESALVEAIEGKRAQPRNKPPFIAGVGLWDKPTVVNNVETLVFAAAIAAKGAAWFNSHGVNGFRGLKFVSVSGDVQAPGVFEVPMGTTYEDLIYEYAKGLPAGRELVAFAPSGPSSGYLPASKVKLPLDWKTLAAEKSMVGSAAIVVCATGTCMLDMAINAVRFYRNESCGKCVACRSGSRELVEVLERWTRGMYQQGDDRVVQDLSHALRMTSICGLGQIAPTPIESVFRHFRAEVDEHILRRRCPAGVCFREEKTASQTVADFSPIGPTGN